jgi:hypothetical protein
MPVFDERALAKLDTALASFHMHKDAILAAGACFEHFRIPKLELLQHVVPSIRDSSSPMQWSADVTEHAHMTEIKNPAHAEEITRIIINKLPVTWTGLTGVSGLIWP